MKLIYSDPGNSIFSYVHIWVISVYVELLQFFLFAWPCDALETKRAIDGDITHGEVGDGDRRSVTYNYSACSFTGTKTPFSVHQFLNPV